MAHSWKTINHKFTANEHRAIKREARAGLERISFDKLRQARRKTQVAVAGGRNINEIIRTLPAARRRKIAKEAASIVKAYRSPAFAAIHEGMADLHEVGVIDAKTMREFDRSCLK